MKLADIDRVNRLVAALSELRSQIATAERVEPAAYQLVIDAPGDAGMRMSIEGASTAHSHGVNVSTGFLEGLKKAAIEELRARRQKVLADLAALGVEAEG